MRKFLQQIARIYWSKVGSEVGEMCFVFPNNRSAQFFRHYLGMESGTVVFAPRLLTINDFFAELSGLESVDKISSLYRLYTHYAELMWPGEEPKESFDQFVYWGDILLSDFDDVDKYMADARLLFANIKDLNEIGGDYAEILSERQIEAIREFWRNFLVSGPESPKIKSFRTTWSILFQLYTDFREELEADGLGYEGMIYRKVAESIKSDPDGVVEHLGQYGKIVFVGLNALNECEKCLLNLIRDRLDGDFYWDFEDERTRNDTNKASYFLKKNVASYKSKYALEPSLPATQQFSTFAVPSATGQTRVAHDILTQLCKDENFNPMETAIVLPDEKLLMPMLSAVPEQIKAINITMGYPLSASNAATFITFIEHLHRNARKDRNSDDCFYHRDVINLLNHPFFTGLPESDKLIQEIINNNYIYPEVTFLSSKGQVPALLFQPMEETDEVYPYLLAVIDQVSISAESLDKEFLFRLRTAVQRIQTLHIPMRLDTCFSLIGQIVSSVSVPFEGKPLHGLQIMGPLETRALDFKNIIILSMTEGTFPKRSISGSFIPYNIRLGFGLPNYEFQDALSSYYFYRSIARAENITFIYDSTTGGMQSGEASRFIKQLKYHFGVELNQRAVSFPLNVNAGEEKPAPEVAKSPEILAALKARYLEGENPKAFSASSLNTYIQCPLSFYYQYVARIEEADEVTEGLDAGLFGSIFHRTMELLYEPCKKSTMSAEDFHAISANASLIDDAIDRAFHKEAGIDFISGRNLIIKQLIHRFVVQVTEVDAGKAPLEMVDCECPLSAAMELGDGSKAHFFGFVDRLDKRPDGKLRIIDYKTGSVKDKYNFKQISDIFSSDESRPIAFQLFMYAFLALENKLVESTDECIPTIYALRTIFDGTLDEMMVMPQALDEWKQHLKALLEEIFDPKVPFRAAESDQACQYCNYKILCGR